MEDHSPVTVAQGPTRLHPMVPVSFGQVPRDMAPWLSPSFIGCVVFMEFSIVFHSVPSYHQETMEPIQEFSSEICGENPQVQVLGAIHHPADGPCVRKIIGLCATKTSIY